MGRSHGFSEEVTISDLLFIKNEFFTLVGMVFDVPYNDVLIRKCSSRITPGRESSPSRPTAQKPVLRITHRQHCPRFPRRANARSQ